MCEQSFRVINNCQGLPIILCHMSPLPQSQNVLEWPQTPIGQSFAETVKPGNFNRILPFQVGVTSPIPSPLHCLSKTNNGNGHRSFPGDRPRSRRSLVRWRKCPLLRGIRLRRRSSSSKTQGQHSSPILIHRHQRPISLEPPSRFLRNYLLPK